MEYIKYCSFLNSLERRFQDQLVNKTPEQRAAMLHMANEIIEDFRKIYGDRNEVSNELLDEARTAAFELPFSPN